jgi:hypothetical protein
MVLEQSPQFFLAKALQNGEFYGIFRKIDAVAKDGTELAYIEMKKNSGGAGGNPKVRRIQCRKPA